MAVLKDLIVHGASRFLNGIRAADIIADNMWADVGIFNQLIATSLKAETADIGQLTAQNATVYGVMDVKGKLQTNNWEAANISSVGGNFYISPTGKSSVGTVTITRTAEATQSSDATYNIQMSGTFAVSSTSSTIWSAGALGMATGNITVGNKKYPLGTCDGTLSNISTGTNSITGFTINNKTSAVLDIIFAENASLVSSNQIVGTGSDLQVSVYQGKSGDNYYPVGILLTSYGKSGDAHQYIDIYSGTDATSSWSASTGFAQPSVRIGDLNGLPSYPNSGNHTVTPQGWGLYTTNGYFKGDVFANTGYIGTFTIDSSSMHAPQNRAAWNTNADGIWIAANVIAGGKQMGSAGTGYTTTDPIWYIKADGSAKFGAMTVDSAGVLSVPAATITGKLEATQINVSGVISAGSITTGTITMGTAGSSDYIYVSKDSKTLTINGESKAWKIVSGNTFGVTSAGYMTASSGKIGTWKVSLTGGGTTHCYNGALYGQSTDGTYDYEVGMKADGSTTDTDSSGYLAFYISRVNHGNEWTSANRTNVFSVTQGGALTATKGKIAGWTINGDYFDAYGTASGVGTSSNGLYRVWIQASPGTNGGNHAIEIRSRETTSASWVSNFYVLHNGKMYARNAEIEGKITASSGTIAGWTITGTRIEKDNTGVGASRCGIQNQAGSNDHTVFYAGCSTAAGGSIWDESKTNFFVTNSGYLFCNNAKIKGIITATAGSIGGWTINSDHLSYGTWGTSGGAMIKPAGTSGAKSVGNSGSISGWVLTLGATFGVTREGKMYATSGKIGGFTIGEYLLEARDKLKNETQYWRCGIQPPVPTLASGAACFYAGCTTATGGTVASLDVTNFYVTHSGYLYTNYAYATRVFSVGNPNGGSWISSRDTSWLRRLNKPASSSSYYPALSMLTYEATEWSFGTLGNDLYISKTKWSDYNANPKVNDHTYVKIDTSGNLWAGAYVSGSYVYDRNGTGTNHRVYSPNNKPTPAAIGALSSSGGTLSGSLSVTGTITSTSTITGGATVYSTGNTMCTNDNAQYCGNSSHRWKIVYAVNGSINTSDRKDKDVLGEISFAKDLIMSLEPVQFMWKDGDHRRKRMGFIAQDVSDTCKKLGENLAFVYASYGHEGEDNEQLYLGEKVDDRLLKWGISYDQLIAPIVKVVQDQQREIEQLKQDIQELKNK